jgi:hypothetical protein
VNLVGTKQQINMKKKTTKVKVKPEPRIIDVIEKALTGAGLIVEYGNFGDKSGSWLEVYKSKEVKDMKVYSFSFSFNYEGTILDNVNCFVEKYKVESQGSERIL